MRFGTFYHKGLDNVMVQINKLKAERLFNAGKTVYLLPCLCSPNSYRVSLCPINIEHCYDNSFKNIDGRNVILSIKQAYVKTIAV